MLPRRCALIESISKSWTSRSSHAPREASVLVLFCSQLGLLLPLPIQEGLVVLSLKFGIRRWPEGHCESLSCTALFCRSSPERPVKLPVFVARGPNSEPSHETAHWRPRTTAWPADISRDPNGSSFLQTACVRIRMRRLLVALKLCPCLWPADVLPG